MKVLMLAVALALAGLPAAAMAACGAPSVRLADPALTTLLQGNTVCVPVVTQPTMTWQEFHQAGGTLIDYKRGPSDPVDPTKIVGTWAITGNSTRGWFVTYTYPPSGGTYNYSVWDNGNGTHSFCSANPEIIGKVIIGQVAC
jgi:hypothetical protein